MPDARIACPACATLAPPGARFCDSCGHALDRVCPSCATANRPTARFRNQCGTSLTAPPPIEPPPDPPPDPQAEAPHDTSLPEAPLPEAPLHEGERKHASVLFADVRGSTALIEALDAGKLHADICDFTANALKCHDRVVALL